MTQAAPSATLNDLFTAAVATYGGPTAPVLGSQWTQISMADILARSPGLAESIASVGFSGQVDVNLQTGEVIIADQGTANTQNLVTDTQVAVDAALNAQPVADAFALAGLGAAQDALSQAGVTMSALYTTGHSLGGAESQGQAAMLSVAANPDGTPLLPAGVQITNVSLDAPGIAGLAETGNSSNYTSYNFSAQGDLANLAGGSDLSGTTNVALPVGPSMWATGGLLGLGTAAVIAAPSVVGPVAGGIMVAAALDNALDAHSSLILLNGLTGTALGDTQLSQLNASRYWVAPLPLGNGAPEEPYVRAFPAYGSSTVLNVA